MKNKNHLQHFLYRALLLLFKVKAVFLSRRYQKSSKNYLSICAIFKNEATYLKEWIEFHRLVGVEKFYLYNNNSTDNYLDVLESYIQNGIVVLTQWPMEKGQKEAYNDCISRFRHHSFWIAFIDIDEFLFGTYEDHLPTLLKNYEAYPGIQVNWLVFGSSGHMTRPPGLVTENYVWRESTRGTSKAIVKMSLVQSYRTAHAFKFRKGLLPVTEIFETVRQEKANNWGSSTEHTSVNILRIHHYFWKSREESQLRILLGRACFSDKNPRTDEKNEKNDIQDCTIMRFIPDLKKNMGIM